MKPAERLARILIVDDDAVTRMMAGESLAAVGFDVVEVGSGEDAVARVDEGGVDLVLLDVVLTGIDGFETCYRLRRTAHGQRLPVIMLTGLNDTESIQNAYQAGATDFITKPINWTLLTHRVSYSLRAARVVEELADNRASLANALRIARMGSWQWWPEHDSYERSPELWQLLGLPGEPHAMASASALAVVEAEDRARLGEAMREALRVGTGYRERYHIRRGAEVLTVSEQAEVQRDARGRIVRLAGITQDISERVRAEERAEFLSARDALTGLANRQYFATLMAHALERARRAHERCALLYLDLDRFKRVNDSFGQEAGDQVLAEISQRVLHSVRASDIAMTGVGQAAVESVARMGGDEFTVLLTDLRRPEDATLVAQRMREAVAAPVRLREQELIFTGTIGVAFFPDNGGSVEELISHAEQAMYAAKEAGRDTVRFHDPAMNAASAAKLALETDLRRAIERNELRLHLQPKIDVVSGAVAGAEALVRWQHPARGLVPPGEFIPLAEETGLVVPIGEWVLEAACAQLARWGEAGLAQVQIAVNVSGVSFRDGKLAQRLAEQLTRWSLEPSLLKLEVTESMLMHDMEQTIDTLEALRELRVGLSVDDFGTGYSSLGYLKRFPIDELKIDRAFVKDITEDPNDAAIVGAIIALARSLKLHVVAEGVETVDQARRLSEAGCRVMQGFLFSRPVPVDAFSELLRTPAPFMELCGQMRR